MNSKDDLQMLEETETTTSELPPIKFQANVTPRWFIALIIFAVVVFIVGLILVIVGAIKTSSCAASKGVSTCDWSAEAKRVKLSDYFSKVQETYFRMAPHEIAWHPRISFSDKLQAVKER